MSLQERLQMTLGQLVFQNVTQAAQIEQMTAKIAEVEKAVKALVPTDEKPSGPKRIEE